MLSRRQHRVSSLYSSTGLRIAASRPNLRFLVFGKVAAGLGVQFVGHVCSPETKQSSFVSPGFGEDHERRPPQRIPGVRTLSTFRWPRLFLCSSRCWVGGVEQIGGRGLALNALTTGGSGLYRASTVDAPGPY